MSVYVVAIAPAAEREIRKLGADAQNKVIECLEKLESDPRPNGVEKLSQDPRFWRVKAGKYRVIYAIEDDKKIIIVLIVRHRKDAYRNLEVLDSRLVAATLHQSVVAHQKV